jgi:TRAP transporter 4TM/12TM fusion protein
MAERLNIPYVSICIAAAIPAVLYYLTAFWMVHLEAGKHGLRGIPKDQRPDPIAAIRRQWYLLIPLIGLVWLLVAGYTPLFAGTVGLALTAIFILGQTAVGMAKPTVARLAIWVVLAAAAAALFDVWNFTGLAIVVALLVVATLVARGGKATLHICLGALSDGARSALPVGVACALVGIIIGMMSLTGLDSRFARIILDWAGGSLFLTLFFTMIVCLVLGMGVPTIPNYIITSTMVAPILAGMGVLPIVSHMFVFYFGIMADLTPPVALAAFAAASIAKASFMRIGWMATRIAIAGYVVPYMAVYDPALMFQTGTVFDTVYVTIKAVIGIILWGTTVTGYFLRPINYLERIAAFVAAGFLVVAAPWTDYVGFAASAAFVLWHWLRGRTLQSRPA